MLIKLTESVNAALQMMYACLALTPVDGRVINVELRSEDADPSAPQIRIFYMTVIVNQPDGTDESVLAYCHMILTETGWTDGYCHISRDSSSPSWHFIYDMSAANPTPQPQEWSLNY